MTNISIKQLRYFDALARHGHFGRAAEACSISQPALSVQIKEMEAELNTLLFDRGGRQVVLTGFGEDIAGRVRDILRAVDDLGDMARATKGQLKGRLKIGIIPTIAPYFLPAVLKRLAQQYPELTLHVRETQTRRLLDELNEGALDAAIVALPITASGMIEVPLFTEPMLLVRPESQAGLPVPSPANLAELSLPLLLLEEGHCFRDHALAFCNLTNAVPGAGMDGSSLSTLVQMVGAGIGVTLIPEMSASIETRSARVAVDRFPGVGPARTVGLVWRKSTPLHAQLMEIADVVRSCERGYQDAPDPPE